MQTISTMGLDMAKSVNRSCAAYEAQARVTALAKDSSNSAGLPAAMCASIIAGV
jgi:hypothetical protein